MADGKREREQSIMKEKMAHKRGESERITDRNKTGEEEKH